MEKCLKLYATYTFTTSHNLCHRTTLLNTDVPNCYITLEFITIRLLRSECNSIEGMDYLFLPRSYYQTWASWPRTNFLFQQDGAPAHRARTRHCRFPGARDAAHFIPPTLWPPNSQDLNPVDYSIWSVLQEKVYHSRITDLEELKTRLIDE